MNHDMAKTRLARSGLAVEAPKTKELKGDLERIAATKEKGGTARFVVDSFPTLPLGADPRNNATVCLSCFGGTPPTEGPNPGCCNTCEDVRESYVRRGWSFVNPDAIEQASLDFLLRVTRRHANGMLCLHSV